MRQPRHTPGSWYDRVLRAVSDHGGTASLAQIYDWMLTNGNLRPRDLVLSTNGRPRYHHIVRVYCRQLCEMRELERVRHGVYRATTAELSETQLGRQGNAMPKVSETSLRDIEIALGKYRAALEASQMPPDARRRRYRSASEFVKWLAGGSPFDTGRG